VEENVTLHTERVSIDRRPPSAGSRVDNADFTDRNIEVTETDEEAVIGKTARVKEEVVVHKEATDRVETVHDTVRRQDVEIERDASTRRTSGATPIPTTARPKI
jgi:stress response protein YsnF